MRKPHWRHAEHMRIVLTVACLGLAVCGIAAEFLEPAWRYWSHLGQTAFTLVWIWEL